MKARRCGTTSSPMWTVRGAADLGLLMSKSRESRIAELRSACGCKEGLIALVIGVAGYGIALRHFPIGDTMLQRILLGTAAGLGSAVIGKLFGLLLTQVRLRRLLSEARTVPPRAPPA